MSMFQDWLDSVDRRFMSVAGLSIFDLGDFTWRDTYDGGSSPDAAIREALESWEDWGEVPAGVADAIREALDVRQRAEMDGAQ